MHDRLVAVGEQAVVFGDGAGADGMVGFHALGDVEQLACFADEAQARQPAQQVFEQLAERAGADDSARAAAFGERHVEQLLRGEPLGERRPVVGDGGRVAGEHAAEHVDRGAVVDVAFFFDVAGAFVDRARRGADQPAGARRFRRTWR